MRTRAGGTHLLLRVERLWVPAAEADLAHRLRKDHLPVVL